MFIALELAGQGEKSALRFIRDIFARPKACLTQAEAFGAVYGRLSAPVRNNLPDWDEVERLAGRLADRMLLPDGLREPEASALQQIACPKYEKRVLLTTACEIVKRTRMPMYRRLLGLIDGDGSYSDMLYELLKYYTAVRVVTGNPRRYEAAAEDMMERLGAPVLIGDDLSALGGCVLILAPGEAFGEDAGRIPCPVLAGDAFRPSQRFDLIQEPQTPSTPELERLCPAGISPHRFAAALYDYCGVETGGYAAVKMRYNQRQTKLDEIVRAVMQNAGTEALY